MQDNLLTALERHLPQLRNVSNVLIGQEHGSDAALEDWLRIVLSANEARRFASTSSAHLYASSFAYLLGTSDSFDVPDIEIRIDEAARQLSHITGTPASEVLSLILAASKSL